MKTSEILLILMKDSACLHQTNDENNTSKKS